MRLKTFVIQHNLECSDCSSVPKLPVTDNNVLDTITYEELLTQLTEQSLVDDSNVNTLEEIESERLFGEENLARSKETISLVGNHESFSPLVVNQESFDGLQSSLQSLSNKIVDEMKKFWQWLKKTKREVFNVQTNRVNALINKLNGLNHNAVIDTSSKDLTSLLELHRGIAGLLENKTVSAFSVDVLMLLGHNLDMLRNSIAGNDIKKDQYLISGVIESLLKTSNVKPVKRNDATIVDFHVGDDSIDLIYATAGNKTMYTDNIKFTNSVYEGKTIQDVITMLEDYSKFTSKLQKYYDIIDRETNKIKDIKDNGAIASIYKSLKGLSSQLDNRVYKYATFMGTLAVKQHDPSNFGSIDTHM